MRSKLILAALTAIALAGCATAPMETQTQRSAFTGHATLATVDTFEWHVAPTQTRLKVLAHNATRALNKKEISRDAAKHILARGEVARSLINDALAAEKRGDKAKAFDTLQWAIAAIEDAEITLKGKP